jgi:hypothetical protein
MQVLRCNDSTLGYTGVIRWRCLGMLRVYRRDSAIRESF